MAHMMRCYDIIIIWSICMSETRNGYDNTHQRSALHRYITNTQWSEYMRK